ncbi:MAG: sensor histidine kinase [Clostridia bacterium]|nr:sensor histidine kinase [Clostridia bacterium]
MWKRKESASRLGGGKSIVGRINRMSRMMLAILVTPLVVSLVMMLVFSGRYHQSISRMETIARLKPVVAADIPESVWNLVSGREALAQTEVFALMEDVSGTIDRIVAETGEEDRLELTVAGRTMDTLSQYVSQIVQNIQEQVPVVQNEAILEEIRDVAALVESMLNNYITGEIGVTAAMSDTLNRAVLLTAGAEVLLVALSLFLSDRTRQRTERFVRAPIQQLETVTAQLAQGDLRARIPQTDVVELTRLTDQVNVMADNLESTMRQNVQDARNLKKAELRTLQAQINPHFLYNTLDAIVWKAEAGDQKEVIHLTSALSDFFRISLSSGADWIPISQEKKHISGYLSIQQTRYRDILKYEIDLPDEIGHFYILKLLLQPLVENALYHGIKYRRGGGIIRVTGRQEGNSLLFRVQDTGRGMDAQTLEALKARMAEGRPSVASGTGGFGLVNVNLRIRLYYNQQEGVHIESGPGGTTVSLRVPCLTREDLTRNAEDPAQPELHETGG